MATTTLVKPRRKYGTAGTMSTRLAADRATAERNVEIQDKWASGEYASQTELGEEYGLSQGAVSQIVCNPNACDYME